MPASAFSQPAIYKAATEEAQNRRLYSKFPYVHKWWARRLQVTSTVLVNAALKDAGSPRGAVPVIYDPFMGMGSLVSSGLTAGCNVIAGDVSLVPFFAVRTALSAVDRRHLDDSFERMVESVRADVNPQWTVRTKNGLRPVQFALWVKVVTCPSCHVGVELFRKRIIGALTDSANSIKSYAVCPTCGEVDNVRNGRHQCSGCGQRYYPARGVIAENGIAICHSCSFQFLPGTAAYLEGGPREKIVAVAIKEQGGGRRFVTPAARHTHHASDPLFKDGPLNYPILRGRTTEQILAWGYRSWAELFTPRHLTILSRLIKYIKSEPDPAIRSWLALTVSTSIDFMSTLCSFRSAGMGGSVRHAAAHHILRPALLSLENNVLGPRESSGTLQRIFRTRILSAVPTESLIATSPVQLSHKIKRCYLYHGSSAKVRLPKRFVDAVVTDPPYFSKIFYQDLAQIYVAFLGACGIIEDATATMRRAAEDAVESEDGDLFRRSLTAIWQRCAAVLRPGGVLAFSFRSTDPVAWVAITRSLVDAGMCCYRAEVAQAEAPKTLTKAWTKHPSTLDVMLFCMVTNRRRPNSSFRDARARVGRRCETAKRRLMTLGHSISGGDLLLIRFGQWVVEATRRRLAEPNSWDRLGDELSKTAEKIVPQ
jgi:adenine-specific DNA methylase